MDGALCHFFPSSLVKALLGALMGAFFFWCLAAYKAKNEVSLTDHHVFGGRARIKRVGEGKLTRTNPCGVWQLVLDRRGI